ncbi:MAG: DNA primase [Spirochaetaceae bacterium]|nr:MAG: DNA primase [Spirochaetaceae bacterium]
MRIPDHLVEQISARTDIVAVVGEYVQLTRKGGRYWACCPFHHEKTPSFTINPERGSFYCFGCQKGGSVFTFLMELEGLSFPEAARQLAEKAGIELDAHTPEQDEAHRLLRSTKDLLGRVANSFHFLLTERNEGQEARRYLEERGVSSDIIQEFALGYAPSDGAWLFQFLKRKGYTEDFLAGTGLFSRNNPRYAVYRHRVIFPIRNKLGETVGFGARTLDGSEPKYLNSPESEVFRKRELLYGLDKAYSEIRKHKRFILVEGYLDVLALHQAGLVNAVAPLGTAFSLDQAKSLARVADEALICFDGDKAGVEAAVKAALVCEEIGLDCRAVLLPEGKDPADIALQKGGDALRALLGEAPHIINFLVEYAVNGIDIQEAGGRHIALNKVFPYIDRIRSEVRRETFFSALGDALGVDPQAVRKDFQRGRKGSDVQSISQKSGYGSREDHISLDLYVLLAAAANRDEFSFLRRVVNLQDLKDDRAKELYIALEEAYRSEEQSVERLLERIPDEGLRRMLVKKLASEEFVGEGHLLIAEGARSIRERSFKEKQQQIDVELRRLQRSREGDRREREEELLQKKIDIDRELARVKDIIG